MSDEDGEMVVAFRKGRSDGLALLYQRFGPLVIPGASTCHRGST